MKPYHAIPIQDCGEALVPLQEADFALTMPHPYVKLGAPYGEKSPYFVRQGVRDRLLQAQAQLQQTHPGWRIQIFDAYRPIAVQQFMVDFTFAELVQAQNLDPKALSSAQREAILAQVYEFWAPPSLDPATPPPHSTGAAIDITLVDEEGNPVDMGSPIDEVSPRSFPHHFADNLEPQSQRFHANRELLRSLLLSVGFQQHPNEWWHFSWGDQLWAWLIQQADPTQAEIARYGSL